MNDLMTKSFTNYVDLKKAAMKDLDLEAGNREMSSSTTHMDTDLGLFLEEAEKVKHEMASLRRVPRQAPASQRGIQVPPKVRRLEISTGQQSKRKKS